MNKKLKVVVIGGGTGTFTTLSGLKKYPLHLTAIVAMADDGGSTGILRDELGILPPGDIRQCLIALSEEDILLRKLFSYRFRQGTLKGHNFGNIFLSALQKLTGSMDKAISKTGKILRIKGKVIPATLDNVRLKAELEDGKIIYGEHAIFQSNLKKIAKIELIPKARANPRAVEAIENANALVIGPGDFYSSLVPNFLIKGIAKAVRKSKAKKIYICNLMTKKGHTGGWTVEKFAKEIEKMIGEVHFVIYNQKIPPEEIIKKYARKGEKPTPIDKDLNKNKFIGANLINEKIILPQEGDILERNLIRHHPAKLARLILKIITKY